MIYVLAGCVVAAFGLVLAAIGKLVEHFQDKGKRCKFRRPHPAVIVALDLLDFARSGRALLPPAPAPAGWDRIRAGMRPAPRLVDTSRTLAEMNAAEDGPIVTGAEVGAGWLCEPNPAAVCDDIRARWDRIRADNPGLPGMRDCCLAFDNEPHWRDCEARAVPMSPDPAVKPGVGWQVPDDWTGGWGIGADVYLPGGRGLMRVGKQPWLTAEMPAIAEPDECPASMLLPVDFPGGEQVPLARPFAPQPVYGEVPVATVLEAERLAQEMIA